MAAIREDMKWLRQEKTSIELSLHSSERKNKQLQAELKLLGKKLDDLTIEFNDHIETVKTGHLNSDVDKSIQEERDELRNMVAVLSEEIKARNESIQLKDASIDDLKSNLDSAIKLIKNLRQGLIDNSRKLSTLHQSSIKEKSIKVAAIDQSDSMHSRGLADLNDLVEAKVRDLVEPQVEINKALETEKASLRDEILDLQAENRLCQTDSQLRSEISYVKDWKERPDRYLFSQGTLILDMPEIFMN